MRGDGAQVAAVRRVGQAGHHRHHLGDLLLQLGDLLLPLVDLACIGRGEPVSDVEILEGFQVRVQCVKICL